RNVRSASRLDRGLGFGRSHAGGSYVVVVVLGGDDDWLGVPLLGPSGVVDGDSVELDGGAGWCDSLGSTDSGVEDSTGSVDGASDCGTASGSSPGQQPKKHHGRTVREADALPMRAATVTLFEKPPWESGTS